MKKSEPPKIPFLLENEMPMPSVKPYKRIFIAIGFTGLVRVEWMFARYGQVIPCNWSQTEFQMWLPTYGPLGYLVAEQRNMAVQRMLETDHEWLLFIDHDTILPLDFFIAVNERINKEKIPVWCGLYFTKSVPAEPLLFRGQGNGYFTEWKMGDEVWVDGIPMGCTVIHRSILEVMSKEAQEYEMQGQKFRRVFESPRRAWQDPQTQQWLTQTGTEDLNWCWRIIRDGVFKKAGWPLFAKKQYPFLVDTKLFCKHIAENGVQYPSRGEEKYFERGKKFKVRGHLNEG